MFVIKEEVEYFLVVYMLLFVFIGFIVGICLVIFMKCLKKWDICCFWSLFFYFGYFEYFWGEESIELWERIIENLFFLIFEEFFDYFKLIGEERWFCLLSICENLNFEKYEKKIFVE